jgi:hypothetical protein
VGGKLRTRSFSSAPVPYESGTAECYDYSSLGRDPLRDLIDELEIDTRPMHGRTVILDGTILRDDDDILRCCGEQTLRSIQEFRRRAAGLMPIDRWHPGSWEYERSHPWAGRTCAALLETVSDPVARKYLTIAAHADLATEPHLTSGLTGIENFVMDVPGYIACYAIDGGMSRLAERLTARLRSAVVQCGTRVIDIERTVSNVWRVGCIRDGEYNIDEFDVLVLALPTIQLGSIEYNGDALQSAMRAHIANYDRPGHYLRVSLLFASPFWRETLTESWFTVDGFGGTCVYDESARHDTGRYGVLGFLIAGNEALASMNLDEGSLVERVLETLPGELRREANEQLLEARVHRWCGGVCGQPGGIERRDPVIAHQPDPEQLPGMLVVGDYLFDCTLNGVYRSADLATSLLSAHLEELQRLQPSTIQQPSRSDDAVAKTPAQVVGSPGQAPVAIRFER